MTTEQAGSTVGRDPRVAAHAEPVHAESPRATVMEEAIARATAALLARQGADGGLVFELEADATIPAETILLMHFLGEVDRALERKIVRYLVDRQDDSGGWPLYHGGAADLSCTIKAYWAMKLAGEDVASEPMRRARDLILARGGAARANVFTRYALAFFGLVPWRAVPFLPVEILLLPRWFFFHLSKVSYWSRTVMVPLAVLYSLRARAKNPTGLRLDELFTTPPDEERRYFSVRSRTNRVFLVLERAARGLDPLLRRTTRKRALKRAEAWFVARLNGEDGLGAIFPAMVNAYESLVLLGYPAEHPARATAKRALEKLVVEHDDWAYCQPCVSPVWDTALGALALADARRVLPADESRRVDAALNRAADWLVARQVTRAPETGPADWQEARPELAPGGWAFQYANPHYPDVDDTAACGWALAEIEPALRDGRYADPLARAADWLAGMQSRNGGWGAFDADNTHSLLNEIPFADHGALLDPPTADVSARCLLFLGRMGRTGDERVRARALEYLLAEQEPDGAWFGRWGTNYVYGTWSALTALAEVDDPRLPAARARAVQWLASTQRADGSWGESNDSYFDSTGRGRGIEGTPFHTAWALLGLCAAGAADSESAARAADFLLCTQGRDGLWHSEEYTAPGFPRVFYLRYHGYSAYFPLWALARYHASQHRTAARA